jgi:hypothetical protein
MILACCSFDQQGEVCFRSENSDKILEGYLIITNVNDDVNYVFPDDELKFTFGKDIIGDFKKVTFHNNFQNFEIDPKDLLNSTIYLDDRDSLNEIILEGESFSIHGVQGHRSFFSQHAPRGGLGYLMPITFERDLFVTAIQVQVVNRSLLESQFANSYGKKFNLVVGSVKKNKNLINPNILFEVEIYVNSKKNKWYEIELPKRIDLSEIQYLFFGVRGSGNFYSIGSKNTKRYPQIIGYQLDLPCQNEWRKVENIHLPMIRFKLSNKAN